MANWGQTFAEAYGNSSNLSSELAFKKWQTQQETGAKMLESGFIPTGKDDKADATVFGTGYKFDPHMAFLRSPMGQMAYMYTPQGQQYMQDMIKGMNGGQPNAVGGNVQMPNVGGMGMPGGMSMPSMPSMQPAPLQGSQGSLSNMPPPNMMMKFPGMEIDPRSQAQIDLTKGLAQHQGEKEIGQAEQIRSALQDFGKAAGSINTYAQNYDQALKEGSVGGKVGLATVAMSNIKDFLGGDIQNQVKNYTRLKNVAQPDIALQLTRQILGGARGVASLSGWLRGSLPGGPQSGDTARDMLQTTGLNSYKFMRSIAANGYTLSDLQQMQNTNPDELEKNIIPKLISDAKSYQIGPDEAKQVKGMLVGMTAPLGKYSKDSNSSIIDEYINNPEGKPNDKFDFSKTSTEQLRARLKEIQGTK